MKEENKKRMENKELEKISKKLNILISLKIKDLLGFSLDQESEKKLKQKRSELVYFIADFGLEAKDIAKILGAPIQSVRTLLTPKRRK